MKTMAAAGLLAMLLASSPAEACRSTVCWCVGDCNADVTVSVDELVSGVNIALGTKDLAMCVAFERTPDGYITVDELVLGVHNALHGCPIPTVTPTRTASVPAPTVTLVPTRTRTPTSVVVDPTPTATATIVVAGNTFAVLAAPCFNPDQQGGSTVSSAQLEHCAEVYSTQADCVVTYGKYGLGDYNARLRRTIGCVIGSAFLIGDDGSDREELDRLIADRAILRIANLGVERFDREDRRSKLVQHRERFRREAPGIPVTTLEPLDRHLDDALRDYFNGNDVLFVSSYPVLNSEVALNEPGETVEDVILEAVELVDHQTYTLRQKYPGKPIYFQTGNPTGPGDHALNTPGASVALYWALKALLEDRDIQLVWYSGAGEEWLGEYNRFMPHFGVNHWTGGPNWRLELNPEYEGFFE